MITRQASSDDLSALGRLGARLLTTHYTFDPLRFMAPGRHPEDGYAQFLQTQLDQPDVVILVADVDGALAGYVYAGIEPQSWKELREQAGFIHDVIVAERHQRGGVAARLVDAACEWLRARGAPRVLLWTAVQNEAAQRLFQKVGFRQTMVEMTRELSEVT